jgi:1,4-dihydroxy-2-naphthoate octaprenyltransferase
MRWLVAFVRLGRPQFLVGGFLLYGLGAAVAVVNGATLAIGRYLLGQAAITAIQLMTHYANDYFDVAADRANLTPTQWSGGSRVLVADALSPRVALRAAQLLAAVAAVLVALVFAAEGAAGRAPAVALVAALALAWAYSAPPFRLHSRGLGELTTAIVVTGLAPLVGFLQQAPGSIGIGRLLVAQLPLVGLQFAMLLAIEFPDAAGDAAVGKRTLVVRLGGARAAALYRALLVAIYGAIPLLLGAGLPGLGALGAALMLPVAAWQWWALGTGAWREPQRWEGLAFRAVATLVGTTAAELAAFAWIARR